MPLSPFFIPSPIVNLFGIIHQVPSIHDAILDVMIHQGICAHHLTIIYVVVWSGMRFRVLSVLFIFVFVVWLMFLIVFVIAFIIVLVTLFIVFFIIILFVLTHIIFFFLNIIIFIVYNQNNLFKIKRLKETRWCEKNAFEKLIHEHRVKCAKDTNKFIYRNKGDVYLQHSSCKHYLFKNDLFWLAVNLFKIQVNTSYYWYY